jgi:hypothetical protein
MNKNTDAAFDRILKLLDKERAQLNADEESDLIDELHSFFEAEADAIGPDEEE